ncbi:MAG: FAD-dependent oxidoreductase [Rhodobacterales bacterium]|nr:FAD-dependent oxidoreductase [Rhodobacterales bacterium]
MRTQELYFDLEKETGVSTGFKRVGSISVALTNERMEELKRSAAMARAFGVDVEEISPREIKNRYPHINLERVVGGVFLGKDGQGDPANIALALAKGARQEGAKIYEGVTATKIFKNQNKVTGVEWTNRHGESGQISVNRVPMLEKAGIHTFFNGPESFTPDDAYHLGRSPEMENVWVAAGFNSIGIQSAGGAGMALAQWMQDKEKPFDLGDVDISRMQPFQGNKKYLFERSKETLGLLYADHFPFRQKESARGVRRTPFHEHLKSKGAVFGELAGWERANWFSNTGQSDEYRYSWKRQNWFENSAREHMAVRENVGLYDMSTFGKIRVEGKDAESFLNYLCGANLSVDIGKIVYTQFLNSKGGIEADVTVTRLSETTYLIVTPAATRLADETWLRRNQKDYSVVITDVTAAEGVLALMGPASRALLNSVSPNNFENETNPFGTAQLIEIGMGQARAHRVSYVGELGWELYISSDQCGHIFETIFDAGSEHNLKLCGMHMMDSCRIEKAYRHFGHDITCEDHVLEAGLGFAVDTAKPDFIGKKAV